MLKIFKQISDLNQNVSKYIQNIKKMYKISIKM